MPEAKPPVKKEMPSLVTCTIKKGIEYYKIAGIVALILTASYILVAVGTFAIATVVPPIAMIVITFPLWEDVVILFVTVPAFLALIWCIIYRATRTRKAEEIDFDCDEVLPGETP